MKKDWRDWVYVLETLFENGRCVCEFGNHPLMRDHSNKCRAVRQAVRDAKQFHSEHTEKEGESVNLDELSPRQRKFLSLFVGHHQDEVLDGAEIRDADIDVSTVEETVGKGLVEWHWSGLFRLTQKGKNIMGVNEST